MQGDVRSAIDHLREALRVRPVYAAASYVLGMALSDEGRVDAAIEQYRRAIDGAPDWPFPFVKLAWILATSPDSRTRRPGEALTLIQRARTIVGAPSAAVFDVLAASLAALGEFEQAVTAAETALTVAGSDEVSTEIRERLALYRSGKPYVAGR
jgi:superkiller protein 3